jgi:hypothetical protein
VTSDFLFLIFIRISYKSIKVELSLQHSTNNQRLKVKISMEEQREPNKMGRKRKEASADRVKYTTAINDSLLKWVKHYAINTGVTSADIIENALQLYRYEKERNS